MRTENKPGLWESVGIIQGSYINSSTISRWRAGLSTVETAFSGRYFQVMAGRNSAASGSVYAAIWQYL
jgi:hypothetical protein